MQILKITAILFISATLVSCFKSPPNSGLLPAIETTKETSYFPKVIYGDDNRLDLYQVTDEATLAKADSTVALVRSSALSQNLNGQISLRTSHFGDSNNLCPAEPFREQQTAAFCSGFLVAKNIIVTAGHCISSLSDCQSTKFVFGFSIKTPSWVPNLIENSEVYACQEVIHSQQPQAGADFAVIRLDRDVLNHQPLRLRRNGEISVGQELVVIGHPVGLPTKVAGGASVRSAVSSYFTANLDTYGGNSGSAVFNIDTGDIEGVLVRGETDFISRGGCNVSNLCADGGCRGEDVTKISEALSYIPKESVTPPEEGDPGEVMYASKKVIAIPDADLAGIESTIDVDQAPGERSVEISINITHTWRGDLSVSLITPDKKEYILHHRSGGSADDLVGTFTVDLDSFSDNVELSNVMQPGAWILRVRDLVSYDQGTLNSWSIRFK